MRDSRRSLVRTLFLPFTLLALTTAASCVKRADLKTAEIPAPAARVAVKEVAPLSTLSQTAEIAPLAVPASPVPAAATAPIAPVAAVPAKLAFADLQGLSPKVLKAALDAVACARSRGVSGRQDVLTVIDYSLPSTAPRLWVLDLAHGRVLFHDLVAHGAGSGDNYATQFSNAMNSRQTSLGLFLTEGTYEGGNGYSLRLRGLDPGVNDLAEERSIVMHGAWYVSAQHAREHGRLGRSWGCPALSQEEARPVIDAVKGGSFLFSYAQSNEAVFASSRKCGGGASPAVAEAGAKAATLAPTPAAVALTTSAAVPLP